MSDGALQSRLATGFAVGMLIPFLLHGGFATSGAGSAFMVLGVGILLTLIFVSLAFLIALHAEDRIKGLGICLAVWLFFTVIFDGLVLLAIQLFSEYPIEQPIIAMSMLNPVDLGRIFLLLNFEISALMGFTGAVFQSFFGSLWGMLLTVVALTLWLVVPLLLGLRAFERKNF